MKEAWASKWNFLFLCFAFTTLPLCWYPPFYAKSKSKFSHLACSDKRVKTNPLFWAKFAWNLKIRTVSHMTLHLCPVTGVNSSQNHTPLSDDASWPCVTTVWLMLDLTAPKCQIWHHPLAAAFWGLTSSSKSLLLSGADWNTILTPGSRKYFVIFIFPSFKNILNKWNYGWKNPAEDLGLLVMCKMQGTCKNKTFLDRRMHWTNFADFTSNGRHWCSGVYLEVRYWSLVSAIQYWVN